MCKTLHARARVSSACPWVCVSHDHGFNPHTFAATQLSDRGQPLKHSPETLCVGGNSCSHHLPIYLKMLGQDTTNDTQAGLPCISKPANTDILKATTTPLLLEVQMITAMIGMHGRIPETLVVAVILYDSG